MKLNPSLQTQNFIIWFSYILTWMQYAQITFNESIQQIPQKWWTQPHPLTHISLQQIQQQNSNRGFKL